MKKLTSSLGVFALALGVAGAFAMSPAPKKVELKSSTTYHWFKISDGTYLGPDTEEQKSHECGEEPQVDCVLRADGVNGSNQPTGNQVFFQGEIEL